MEIVLIGRKDFLDFVDVLIRKKDSEIIGVTPKANRFSFEILDAASELCLDFDETTQSSRKFLLPSRDPLLRFATRDASSCEAMYDTTGRVIIGMHPADCAAVALCDKAYTEGESDDQYRVRREATTLIGIYPTQPYALRFSRSMIDENDPYLAADLMMIDMGDETYAIEIVTEKGTKLIAQSAARPADAKTKAAIPARKKAAPDKIALPVKRDELSGRLAGQERHETFTARGDKCFSCGSCVNVCPTCICFDVRDKVDLSLKTGERYRTWDGCTYENFATVAGNHNFRKNPSDRVRHRLFRKTVYLRERFGLSGCVGCGRCTVACTADIASIVEMVGDIVGKGN